MNSRVNARHIDAGGPECCRPSPPSLPTREAGAFDPLTRTLTGPPLGWTLSQYQGVSDGRAEFLGYFRNDDGR